MRRRENRKPWFPEWVHDLGAGIMLLILIGQLFYMLDLLGK